MADPTKSNQYLLNRKGAVKTNKTMSSQDLFEEGRINRFNLMTGLMLGMEDEQTETKEDKPQQNKNQLTIF